MREALAGRMIPYDKTVMDKVRKITHYLDIWHKSAKISAKVMKAVQFAETKNLKPWCASIRNHFWYASKECNGDAHKMKQIWIGLLHHVADEHIWQSGQCEHGPILESDKPLLVKTSPAWSKLQEIVVDRQLLRDMHYFTGF